MDEEQRKDAVFAGEESETPLIQEYSYSTPKVLTSIEKLALDKQNSRLVSEFRSAKIEAESKKHWDLFYKRNDTRFFKDRHWTTREFFELIGEGDGKTMLEVGCGVGNLIYPLLKETKWLFYACDISSNAVQLFQSNTNYDSSRIHVFQSDVSIDNCFEGANLPHLDICTLIFVLSAIHPDKFTRVLRNIFRVLKPGGHLLFRDYGLYDMAQLRFKPGHKIANNHYLRQDGTRSYFFSVEELADLSTSVGFQIIDNCYVHRRTVNIKEGIDVPRIFIQAKLMKPSELGSSE